MILAKLPDKIGKGSLQIAQAASDSQFDGLFLWTQAIEQNFFLQLEVGIGAPIQLVQQGDPFKPGIIGVAPAQHGLFGLRIACRQKIDDFLEIVSCIQPG